MSWHHNEILSYKTPIHLTIFPIFQFSLMPNAMLQCCRLEHAHICQVPHRFAAIKSHYKKCYGSNNNPTCVPSTRNHWGCSKWRKNEHTRIFQNKFHKICRRSCWLCFPAIGCGQSSSNKRQQKILSSPNWYGPYSQNGTIIKRTSIKNHYRVHPIKYAHKFSMVILSLVVDWCNLFTIIYMIASMPQGQWYSYPSATAVTPIWVNSTCPKSHQNTTKRDPCAWFLSYIVYSFL